MGRVRYLFSTPEGITNVPAHLLNHNFVPCPGKKCSSLLLKDYFSLLADFLECKKHVLVTLAGSKTTSPDAFQDIDIISEKIGTFYQIARCRLRARRERLDFCASTSLLKKELLLTDFRNMCLLFNREGLDFLPRPYLTSLLGPGKESERLRIVVSQWLKGYWEWHMKEDDLVEIWIPGKGQVFMEREHVLKLFNRIAFYLGLSFNPITLKHIWLWSNCAGDFVVNISPQKKMTDLKMTTVRYYGSPWNLPGCKEGQENLLLTMLYHFLDTLLVIRIDRMSGTGEYIFASDSFLKGTITGFLNGLMKSLKRHGLKTEWVSTFWELLKKMDQEDLLLLYQNIISVHNDCFRKDARVMAAHLEEHVPQLFVAINEMGLSLNEQGREREQSSPGVL